MTPRLPCAMRCVLAAAWCVAAAGAIASAAQAATKPAGKPAPLRFAPATEGIDIDAGGMGKFTLRYPDLRGQDDKVFKLIEKRLAAGKAVLKYEGDGQIDLLAGADGTIALTFASMPEGLKSFRMGMLIDFNYTQGGTWRCGPGEFKPFPKDKPAKPFLFQGNTEAFALASPQGQGLAVTVPRYSYQQLQDNREWNWKVFDWWFQSPILTGVNTYTVQVTAGSGPAGGPTVRVDKFGQTALSDYPGKVKSLQELQADADAEKAYYDALKPPKFDVYGGLPGSREKLALDKTGFFHVQKAGGRWVMVDPLGNAFFHLGVCALNPCDDYTYIKGREEIYEWLPAESGEFRTAFRPNEGGTALSFHLVNTIRKFGRPYDLESYVARMIARARKWGFNSVGAFSAVGTKAHNAADFPYVAHLPLSVWEGIGAIPGVTGAWDPFDAANPRQVDALFRQRLAPRADDPLLIGYFLVNEPLYEDLPKVIPTLGKQFACKRRLVQSLAEKYKSIDALNKAWGLDAKSFDELADKGLAVQTPPAARDVQDFTGLFLEEYFRLVAEAFRKYDRNHMLLGNRFQSGTINSEQLCRISGRYMDVISFNYYTYYLDKAFLDRIHGWTGDKPMILSEFYFSSPKDSGLPGGGKDVSSQTERGLGYRNYVEQAAALPFVVGVEWFTLVDQSVTGRWFSKYNGENGNTGLISVADRPWKAMLAEMMKTNYSIYDVLLGERKPFVYDKPNFRPSGAGRKVAKVSRAPGEMKMDGQGGDWPGVPAERVEPSRLVQGADAGGVEAAFKLCWDDRFLYVLADVTDPTPMKNEHKGGMIWSADAIELFLGSEALDRPGAMLFTDRQVLLSAGKIDGKCQWHFANSPKQYPCPMAVRPRADGKGYTLEAAIPFEALGVAPAEGKELLFDLAIDDSADGRSRARQLMWNGTARNSGDRTNWGRAVLAK